MKEEKNVTLAILHTASNSIQNAIDDDNERHYLLCIYKGFHSD